MAKKLSYLRVRLLSNYFLRDKNYMLVIDNAYNS